MSPKGRHPIVAPVAPARRAGQAAASGFTLIELMVAVAIVAVLGMAALPGFSGAMVRSNIRSLSSNLGTDLTFARSEAIRLGSAVTVCPRGTGNSCGTDWRNGWFVFREDPAGADGLLGAGETILRDQAATPSADYTITRASGSGAITFMASGSTRNAAAVTLRIRHPYAEGRDLAVSVIGRLSTNTASN